MELNAIACLDDTTNHKDQVHIAVAEGETVVVPVSARGTGTTIFCHERLEEMDFGSQFSSTILRKKGNPRKQRATAADPQMDK